MDSNAYTYLINNCIESVPHVAGDLPARFVRRYNAVNTDVLKAVAYFLLQFVPESSESRDPEDTLPRPSILNDTTDHFFPVLFKTVHRTIAHVLAQDNEASGSSSFKRNGSELLTFLCHAVTQKRITIFRENDALSLAMCCFLIEACMHVGWCPNAFENRAKRAAHLYFSLCRKSLYTASDTELSTIVGYLQSAWICAQKTEGIEEHRLEWEHSDLTHRYIWEIKEEKRTIREHFTLYKTIHPPLCIVMPQYRHSIPHPFRCISTEGHLGVSIFHGEEPVQPVELTDSVSINRSKFRGERLTYACAAASGLSITWTVAIQIFNLTVYRIDVLKSATQDCMLSPVELRLENNTPLAEISANVFYGKGTMNTIALEFVKNPFNLTYNTQHNDITLFRGKGAMLPKNKPVEMITAWAVGKEVSSIDRTNLYGIFE